MQKSKDRSQVCRISRACLLPIQRKSNPKFYEGIYFHPFRHSPLMQDSTLVKLGLRKKDTLHSESDLLSEWRETEISNSNNNQLNILQAREAMDRFKMQEVGVNLTNGHNGHLTSREADSVDGQMVKKMYPVQTSKYERNNRTAPGHIQAVKYIAAITV